jgi:hypothetical protein
MTTELEIEPLESLTSDERAGVPPSASFEHYDNFDFDQWAGAVKRQLLAALRKQA